MSYETGFWIVSGLAWLGSGCVAVTLDWTFYRKDSNPFIHLFCLVAGPVAMLMVLSSVVEDQA